jgi:DNA-binding MarR family transcriptional regulator
MVAEDERASRKHRTHPEEAASETSSPHAAVVADRLHSAAIHLLRRLRAEDAASGLTAPRLSALSVIVYGGPVTLGALAAAEQVRPPTMTRLVTALEQAGLVTRNPATDDRRQILLCATPEGRRLLEEGRARRTASLARRLAALPAADLAALAHAADLLERLARPPEKRRQD